MARRRPIVAALALAALALGAAPAAASRGQGTIIDPSQELTGDLASDCTPGGLSTLCDQALNEVRALGADYVRVLVFWRDVVASPNANNRPCGAPGTINGPQRPGSSCYLANWGRYDGIVRAIAARGMRTVLVPTGKFPRGRVPRWASNDSRDTDPDPTEFRWFLQALGRRYGGSFNSGIGGPLPAAAAVGVWNEGNSAFQLSPQRRNGRPYAPRLYRRLFKAATRGLGQSGYRGQVWIGETAPRGNSRAQSPIAFMRSVLCMKRVIRNGRVRWRARCGLMGADGWAHHPHTGSFAPFARPFAGGDVTTANLRRMVVALKQAKRAGALPNARLLITEYGVQSDPPDEFLGVSPRRQAEFLGIAEYLAYRLPQVKVWSQYLLRDDDALGGFQSGLRFRNGAIKPAHGAFRTPLVARRRGRRVLLWGEVRPVKSASVQIEKRDAGGAFTALTRVFSTNRRGYFTRRTRYRRGRVYRLVWNDAADGRNACPGRCFGPPIGAYRF